MDYYQAQNTAYFKKLGFRIGSHGKEFVSLPQYSDFFEEEELLYFKTTRVLNKKMCQFVAKHKDDIRAFESQKSKEKVVLQEEKKIHKISWYTTNVTATAIGNSTATATAAAASGGATTPSGATVCSIETLLLEKKAQLETAKMVVSALEREIEQLEAQRTRTDHKNTKNTN